MDLIVVADLVDLVVMVVVVLVARFVAGVVVAVVSLVFHEGCRESSTTSEINEVYASRDVLSPSLSPSCSVSHIGILFIST